MSLISKIFTTIIVGLIVVIYIIYSLSSNAKSSINDLIVHYEEQVQVENIKSLQLHEMRVYARERVMILLTMANTDDPFLQDTLYMKFRSIGGAFLKARETLKEIELNHFEKEILQQQRDISLITANLQNEVAELLLSGDKERAKALLFDKTIPAQQRVLSIFDRLLEEKLSSIKRLDYLKNQEIQSVREIDIYTSLAIALTIVVVVFVMLILSRITQHLEKSQHALELAKENLQQQVLQRTAELTEANKQLEGMAKYDPVTRLPNRYHFMDYLDISLENAKRNQRQLAVFYMDLDGFKAINDQYGHLYGDELLKQVASRLSSLVRKTDMVSRLGGDEFALIYTNLTDDSDLERFAKRIIACIAEPYQLDGVRVNVSTSIGISQYPFDAQEIEKLIKMADEAMYLVKKSSKNNFCLYSARKFYPHYNKKASLAN